jgi:hypothetical protein
VSENLIRLRGDTNIAAAHRDFSYRPSDVLEASAQPDRRTDSTTHQRIQDFAQP